MNRRGFLCTLACALAAPAIIRTPGLLMPVRVGKPDLLLVGCSERYWIFHDDTRAKFGTNWVGGEPMRPDPPYRWPDLTNSDRFDTTLYEAQFGTVNPLVQQLRDAAVFGSYPPTLPFASA